MRIRDARRLVAFVAFAVLAFAESADAQLIVDARVAAGTPLRLVTRSGHSETALYAGQSDSGVQVRYVCRDRCDEVFSFGPNDLARVDALIGHGHSVGQAVLGGLFGGVSSALLTLGAATLANSTSPCHFDRPGDSCPSLALILLSPIIVASGTTIGAAIGWHHQRETWERVWPVR